jgi:hypothetical protein
MVASDFGSDYRTHTHVTSEALYASLTRGATWRPHLIDLRNDPDAFTRAYNVAAIPVWFLPGIFMAGGSHRLPDDHFDTTTFNVVHEFYPSTSRSYIFKMGSLRERGRPYYIPTYGTIQSVMPDQRLLTYCFSARPELLQRFAEGQTFLMGKKRTMFQVLELSGVVEGRRKRGKCNTGWLELYAKYSHYWQHFASFEVSSVTLRYIILRGATPGDTDYIEFTLPNSLLCVPDFYFELLKQERLCEWIEGI